MGPVPEETRKQGNKKEQKLQRFEKIRLSFSDKP